MNQKIIFVDDEVKVLKALERDMASADIDAEYFTSAEAALGYLDQHQVGIAVSELNLPRMDGITFLKEIQKTYPETYRVILSSSGIENLEFKKALEDRTIEQCFDKPLSVNELLTYFAKFKSNA